MIVIYMAKICVVRPAPDICRAQGKWPQKDYKWRPT